MNVTRSGCQWKQLFRCFCGLLIEIIDDGIFPDILVRDLLAHLFKGTQIDFGHDDPGFFQFFKIRYFCFRLGGDSPFLGFAVDVADEGAIGI